jgi:hypothetical protein
MTHQQREGADRSPAIAAGRARFRRLPERIRPEDTFVVVPVAPAPARDAYDHDAWLVRNVWCGSLF